MKVAYGRTSGLKQEAGLEHQIAEFKKLGVDKIFSEQISSVKARPQLDQALAFVREGDEFIVTKIDRLARSTTHLLTITKDLAERGVKLRILDISLDTETPMGKMMLTMIGAIAQFERELMLERQQIGIKKAQDEGKYAQPRTKRINPEEIARLIAEGLRPVDICKRLKCSSGHFYRIKAQLTKNKTPTENV